MNTYEFINAVIIYLQINNTIRCGSSKLVDKLHIVLDWYRDTTEDKRCCFITKRLSCMYIE